ncbi:hypothetical protein ACUOA8_60035, partial [Escherichia sp. SS-MK2]
ATTQFDATKVHSSGFVAPYTLSQGLTRLHYSETNVMSSFLA